ncbi:hypothetical protein CR203_24020 [Salipaludibacillus neizhouensis]|uniref:PIN domain-containing protein n=1 Tax=Salipaludibacillus neizhouensis TaxID=885475 RepID=A0A3A9K0V6_9BACI|nr:hypothetical protein [Salipaludibacillus neizhouensis]RKL64858.1 hypothetical protein CR203_24020 [Salipaludibacillus neizhouensis]
MAINFSDFQLVNVIDTCSIWNLLSSDKLYSAALNSGCSFTCTRFVTYECLHKKRKLISSEDLELQERLVKEQKKGRFEEFHITIEDLQDVEILQNSHCISKGELSSIAFAKRINQAFLTDDQEARQLASKFMQNELVQTIPHLFGWFFYKGQFSDSDKELIITQHEKLKRTLSKHFEKAYLLALEKRLMHLND